MSLQEWLERYRRAWEEADADAVVGLFDDRATHRSNIFQEAHVGREAIHGYWTRATKTQDAVKVQIGHPISEGDRVAVEWWATMRDEGDEITLPGCLLLTFGEDGRCRALREYWQVEQGWVAPPPDWGDWSSGRTRESRRGS